MSHPYGGVPIRSNFRPLHPVDAPWLTLSSDLQRFDFRSGSCRSSDEGKLL
jgi:hypothetical protein